MVYNQVTQEPSKPRPDGLRGRLLTFEGIDGSGKSTHIARVVADLQRNGKTVVCLREPGGTATGEAVRRIVLDREQTRLTAESELLLFMAARAQLVREIIRPALADGAWVLCDRFIDSTLAYQGYGRGLDLELIDRLNDFAVGDCRPDLTVLLSLTALQSVERIRGRGGRPDRLDGESEAFAERVIEGYRRIAAAEPGRIRVVDANRPETVVADEIATIWGRAFADETDFRHRS